MERAPSTSRRDRARVRRGLNVHGSTDAAVGGVRCSTPIFDPPIERQDGFVTPPRVARFGREIVPVGPVASRPDHDVDAGAAAEHLPHAHRQHPPVQVGVRLRPKRPVALAPKIGRPKACLQHARAIVATARLEQQYVDGRILCQAPRHNRAGRPQNRKR